MTRHLKLACAFALAVALATAAWFPLSGRHVSAQGAQAAQLMPRGDVKINGNPAAGSMAVASGSRITTGKTGYAILSIANVGQFYMGDNSEIVVNFLADRVRIELAAGILRCIKSSGSVVQVFSTRCTHIDVIKGNVATFSGPEASAPAIETIGEAQARDYPESAYTRFDSTGMDDFRCAVFDCAVSASPALPVIPPVVPVIGANPGVLATVVAAGAITGIIPIITTGQDDAPVSPARP
ncbi:hypothetical protein [Chloracidobacterium aggregatum]|uniref:FecR protein domain-containing protein n=1 Tax=Chloracidobacterium sp. N TaxID=2821540 RepID=A0ABX8B3E6_9BACT|nr:hypothetical protein [Chloracidobacterium aggregatum]QUV86615.1 hypothetical protein J8C03_13420 [Chloracidobacterium sp. 2]QUV88953.1 hypothetical protein J8C07_14050 [Chloracidobacterium sp. S]QUV92238.1 hypothetical protein J8C04_15155 [Chloracidobacterium sp. A]QUV95514.1 hypothetical protein J8C05_11790 [Chloracidobacterium sp. N]QUV98736.1 hypothetical protein J8C00_13015 [Chloracidobacterium sp. E]